MSYRMVMVNGSWKAIDDSQPDPKPEVVNPEAKITGMFSGNTLLTPRFGWMIAHEEGQKPAEIVRRFGISRKTFYKWLKRYKNGDKQLLDRSRRPHHMPRQTPQDVVSLLISEQHITGFGQRRLKRHMMLRHNVSLSERTIWKILKKNRAVSSSG
jgi:transposase